MTVKSRSQILLPERALEHHKHLRLRACLYVNESSRVLLTCPLVADAAPVCAELHVDALITDVNETSSRIGLQYRLAGVKQLESSCLGRGQVLSGGGRGVGAGLAHCVPAATFAHRALRLVQLHVRRMAFHDKNWASNSDGACSARLFMIQRR